MNAALSDAVVRTLQEYTGRGATRARTIVDRDVVMVILEDTLTKGEQVLVEHGRAPEVLRIRQTFQEAMRAELVAAVQELTGRGVRAFMSTNHTQPDYSVEIFVLGDVGEPTTATTSAPGGAAGAFAGG